MIRHVLRCVRSTKNRSGLRFLGLALGMWLGSAVPAQAQDVTEYQLKAVFLYHFGSFVEWPEQAIPDSERRFTIGVLGDDPFGDALETIAGRVVGGRVVEVRHFESVADLNGTHILFVASSEGSRMDEVIEAVGDRPILTVSDEPDFTEAGGVIRFVLSGQKLQLEVNPCAATRAGLRISSRLLSLADLTDGSCTVGER